MAGESRPRKLAKYVHINPELPTKIIFHHILPRLPPEALMRCRRVCKSWSSLIRNPSFVADFDNFHRKTINKSTTNFLFQKNTRLFSTKIEEEEQQQGGNNILNSTPVTELSHLSRCEALDCYPNHVQSVHGLVCASSRCGPVFILNPSTQESIELPYVTDNYRLASATYHFGFSPATNEYKVLQILSFLPDQHGTRDIRFNTFTLGRDSSWRPLQVEPTDLPFDARAQAYEIMNGRSTGCVCLNGAVHWIHETKKMIVVFDVSEESFRVVPLPEDYAQEFREDKYGRARTAWHASIVEVGGCVGVFVAKSRRQTTVVLWILNDYQNVVWVKETISEIPRRAGSIYVEALSTIHTGELAIALYFRGKSTRFNDGPPQLLLYDIEHKGYRILDFVFPNNMGVARGIPMKLIASYDNSIVPLK